MAPVKFGAVYPMGTPLDVVGPLELAEKAEAWGYDSFWVPDLLTGPDLDPFVILSGAAARTERIKLGTGVLIMPVRPPVQLAKTALSLDALSGGRLILGAGLGEYSKDVRAAQIAPGPRAELSDEGLEVLRSLVNRTNVSHQGRYHQIEDLTMLPRPTRKGGLPIWTSAAWKGQLVDGPLKRAARYGDGFIFDAPPPFYRQAKERISEYAVSFGRDPDAMEWGCWMFTCLGSSKEEAWKTLGRRLGEILDRPTDDPSNVGYAFGTPEDCLETIQQYIDIGLTHICISAKCPPEQVVELYETLASEVIPRLK